MFLVVGADTYVFILWFGTFSDKTGRDTVFSAVLPVLVVGIDSVGTAMLPSSVQKFYSQKLSKC